MSYVRADGYKLKDPDDDAAYQTVVGDLQRLAIALYNGTANAAYLRRDQGLNDLVQVNTGASLVSTTFAQSLVQQIGQVESGTAILTTNYFSSGTHTFTGTSAIIDFCGGGGAGGGHDSSYNTAGGGGGGSAARVILKAYVTPGTTMAYSVGSGGLNVSGSDGQAGGSSTVTLGTVTYTASGGYGGYFDSFAATNKGGRGGVPLATPSINPFVIAISGQSGCNGSFFTQFVPGSFYGTGGTGGTGHIINPTSSEVGQGGDGGWYSAGTDGTSGMLTIYEFA